MKNYYDLLKELGLDDEHIKALKKSRRRYAQYKNQIEEFNKVYLDNASTIPVYTSKQLYERVKETKELPNYIIDEIVKTLYNEVNVYKETGVSSMVLNLFDETERAINTVLANSSAHLPALEHFSVDNIKQNIKDYENTELKVLIEACEEFIDTFNEYSSVTDWDSVLNNGGKMYSALINLNDVFSLFV